MPEICIGLIVTMAVIDVKSRVPIYFNWRAEVAGIPIDRLRQELRSESSC